MLMDLQSLWMYHLHKLTEHQGRQFSRLSNLLQHQLEQAGQQEA